MFFRYRVSFDIRTWLVSCVCVGAGKPQKLSQPNIKHGHHTNFSQLNSSLSKQLARERQKATIWKVKWNNFGELNAAIKVWWSNFGFDDISPNLTPLSVYNSEKRRKKILIPLPGSNTGRSLAKKKQILLIRIAIIIVIFTLIVVEYDVFNSNGESLRLGLIVSQAITHYARDIVPA